MRIPGAWAPLLEAETSLSYYKDLERFVAAERRARAVLPGEEDVYRALELTPPGRVRVVILGQDPYPDPAQAHGLAFSVKPGVAIPASLRNIFKELATDVGAAPPVSGSLAPWAEQGVLLLNTVLTVRAGEIGSHRGRGWERFTDALLRRLAETRALVCVLWGNDARAKRPLLEGGKNIILESAHPSPLSARRGFFGSRPFSRANDALCALGREPIRWDLNRL